MLVVAVCFVLTERVIVGLNVSTSCAAAIFRFALTFALLVVG